MEHDGLQLLTADDICERLRIGRSTLAVYRRGDFPEPLRIGPPDSKRPALRWDLAAVSEWVRRGQS